MGDGEPTADGGVTELVRRCKAGDVAALEALYRRYVDRVWRLGWFWTHSGDEAADVVQETFLRVARSINRFEQRSAFTTWLFAITRSVAIEHLRKGRRDRPKADDPRIYRLVPPPAEPPDSLSDQETRQAVREAVAGLPGAQRDAIVMCELSDMSIRDASVALGWTESRVKVTLFRARRKLRDRLETYVREGSARRGGKRG